MNKDAVGKSGVAYPLEVERGKIREFARAIRSEDPRATGRAHPTLRSPMLNVRLTFDS